MRLLIIGGTRFLGRHVAALALERGHVLTLLHRGRSGAGLFPQAQHLIADRDGDLSLLGPGEWDAVIDTSAYLPRQVCCLAAQLAGRVAHYQLTSSISVFKDFGHAGMDEDAATVELADPTVEAVTGETYGGLKRLCEEAAQQAFGAACCIVRPGLIVGPHDPTGRFTWWVTRLQRGGAVLAPGSPEAPVQFIDARDLAAWMLLLAEKCVGGIYNATGPDAPLTFGQLLQAMREQFSPQATLRWADEAWLLAQGVAPWSELPLWLPRASHGMLQIDAARARAAGLNCCPLRQTLADTAAWAVQDNRTFASPEPSRPAVGLSRERESQLLCAFERSA